MDASATHVATGNSVSRFRSRPGALIWFFRKSRDCWKGKYQKLRAALKRERNQVVAVTKSREQWKRKAEQAIVAQAALQREYEALRVELTEREKKREQRSREPSAGSRRVRRRCCNPSGWC